MHVVGKRNGPQAAPLNGARTPNWTMNPYHFLADLVAVVHFGYVAFVVLGLVAILAGLVRQWAWTRNFWFRTIHLLLIAVVVIESLGGIVCPLTTWERALRGLDAEAGQPGSFVGRIVNRLLFFDLPEWVFRVLHCMFGAAVLMTFVLAPPRWPWSKTHARS